MAERDISDQTGSFFMISPSVFDYTKGEFMSWKMINYVNKYVLLKKKIYIIHIFAGCFSRFLIFLSKYLLNKYFKPDRTHSISISSGLAL